MRSVIRLFGGSTGCSAASRLCGDAVPLLLQCRTMINHHRGLITTPISAPPSSLNFTTLRCESTQSVPTPRPPSYKSQHAPKQQVASSTAASSGSHGGDSSTAAAMKFKSVVAGIGMSCSDEGPAELRELTPLQRRQFAMKDKKAFSLTTAAVKRIKHLLAQKAPDEKGNTVVGVRIGVKRRGCSGYSYSVNYEWSHQPTKQPNDTVVVQDDVVVFVSGDALFYVIGTEMDYIVSPVEQKFTFRNPNEKGKCGCGESFTPFDV